MKIFFSLAVALCFLSAPPGFAAAADSDEVPMRADDFINSIGINVHLHYGGTPYRDDYPTFKKLLLELGVRHLRDGATDTTWKTYYDRFNELGRAGIKTMFIFKPTDTASYIAAFPSRVRQGFEAFEAPNEYNQSKDPDWANTLHSFQVLMYRAVKSDPSVSMYPVVGPSLTNRQAQETLGDLSRYLDYGNLHNYFGARNPGTLGWGPNGYGSIETNKLGAAVVHADKPIMTTETGYCDFSGGTGSTPEVSGIYEPRMFLVQHQHGIARTLQYEMFDTGNPNGVGGHCGLIDGNVHPKPAYYALKSMIQLLADPGPAFPAKPLAVQITGHTANVDHQLFEKRDGSYILAIWIEKPGWDPNAQARLAVAPQSVSVTLGHGVSPTALWTYDDGERLQRSATGVHGPTLSLSATEKVTFLEMKP